MSQPLDHIIKKTIFDTTTVDANFTSDAVAVDRAEGGIFLTMVISGGNGLVNMTLSIEVSGDGTNFAQVTDSIQAFTDDDGSYSIDLLDTNATWVRVRIDHTAGSADFRAFLTAQRRH